MKARRLTLMCAACVILAPLVLLSSAVDRIQVVQNDAGRRVDVLIGGKPFTSYVYPTSLKKPTLYPILTAKGTVITRGYPLDPKLNERVDHPHHVGLWFNSGDVNGLDFWNNSDAIPAAQAPKMGTILHRKVVEAKGGADEGHLIVEMDWVTPENTPLVHERTEFIFRGTGDVRSIERIATLTAFDKKVNFNDNKEAMFGMRVVRELELPYDKAEILVGADGKPTKTPVNDNTGVSGQYTSSEGLKGDAVWSTRGRWVMLGGTVNAGPVTIAMLDHPSNPGYPTHWHARGYGLFAANPLGEKVFGDGKTSLDLALDPGKSVTFRYRVVILDNAATPAAIEKEYAAFTSKTAAK